MKNDIKIKKEFKEQYMQHLNFIQNTIERHNANSFQIKMFAITIFSAITTLYISFQQVHIYFVSFVVTIIFWFLDATYLLQERRFRNLYDDAVKYKVSIYSMNINKYKNNIFDYIKVMFSKTLKPLYIALLLLQLIIMYYIKC